MNEIDVLKIRESLDLTQKQLAKIIAVNKKTIVKWEEGMKVPASIIALLKLMASSKKKDNRSKEEISLLPRNNNEIYDSKQDRDILYKAIGRLLEEEKNDLTKRDKDEPKIKTAQQLESVIDNNDNRINNTHPKFDPNYWNKNCFELFKYLFDVYYKVSKRELTNIWFFLKYETSEKYILKVTQKNYKIFILNCYQIKITNFDKAPTKWEDKECQTLQEHRINFEDTVK
jgi:DNA-binding XRE family transcriptional regulator